MRLRSYIALLALVTLSRFAGAQTQTPSGGTPVIGGTAANCPSGQYASTTCKAITSSEVVQDLTKNFQYAAQIGTGGDTTCPALDSTKPLQVCLFSNGGLMYSAYGATWLSFFGIGTAGLGRLIAVALDSKDTFNFTGDLVTKDTNWQAPSGSAYSTTGPGELHGTNNSVMNAMYKGTFNNDQHSCITYKYFASGNAVGLGVRLGSSGGGYILFSTPFQLSKNDGVYATIGSTNNTPPVTGHEYCLTATGTTITATDMSTGTTLLTITDSTYPSGNPGIAGYGNQTNNAVSSWHGGNNAPAN